MGKKKKFSIGDAIEIATSVAGFASAVHGATKSTTKAFDEGVKTNLKASEGGISNPALKKAQQQTGYSQLNTHYKQQGKA